MRTQTTDNSLLNKYAEIITPKNGTVKICPRCKKEFKVTDETRYLVKGQYTCSWRCFIDKNVIEAVENNHSELKAAPQIDTPTDEKSKSTTPTSDIKRKRGRPPKVKPENIQPQPTPPVKKRGRPRKDFVKMELF